jgi:hypothetical protein
VGGQVESGEAFSASTLPTWQVAGLRSVRRPLGIAIALVAVCTVTLWVATNMATAGEFRYNAADFAIVFTDMFGESSGMWLILALIGHALAAMLVLIWGATRVVRPAVGDSPLPLVMSAVVMAVLALAVVVFLQGVSEGWWPIGIAAVIVAAAAAWAVQSGKPNILTTP